MEVLSRDDCLRRLGPTGIGRVAVSFGALPAVLPVNYAVLDGDVVFQTTPGTKLAAATRNAVVAFEVDDIDRLSHMGWSVMVVGPAHEVTDPAELAATGRLPLTRWVRGGGPPSVVRIRAARISGRQLTHEPYGPDSDHNRHLPMDACPTCGSDALEVVSDGELTNIVCAGCLACWHFELGAIYAIPAGSCPGCRLRELCDAAHIS